MTSRELSEWRAYEYATGPIDDGYQHEMIRTLTEYMHDLLYVESLAPHFKKVDGQGPVEQRKGRYPNPAETYKFSDE
jgi:hypothetical protein